MAPTKKVKAPSTFSAASVKRSNIAAELTQTTEFSLSAFDPDSAYYAVVSKGVGSERVRIWDTQTSALLGEHVVDGVVDICWGVVGEEARKRRRGEEKHAGVQGNKCLGITLKSGAVQIYSLSHGSVMRALDGLDICSFVFGGDGIRGFSGLMNGEVVEWDVRTGMELGRFKPEATNVKQAVKRVCVADERFVIGAGMVVSVWDRETRKLVKKFPGHATSIISMRTFNDWCLTTAEEDRAVSVWEVKEDKNGNVASLTVDAPMVDLAIGKDGRIAALTEEGVVFLWKTAVAEGKKDGKKNKKAPVSIAKAPDGFVKVLSTTNGTQSPILGVAFAGSSLIIARGSTVKPVFERIGYTSEEDDTKIRPETILKRQPLTSLLLDARDSLSQVDQTPHQAFDDHAALTLGPEDLPLSLPATTTAEPAEPTLESRLASLQVTPNTPQKSKSMKKRSATPTASSLHHMLSQALHTDDIVLLEQSLQTTSPSVINATIRRLPPAQVIPLLDHLTSRLQRRPERAALLLEWIRSIVICHMSYLTSVPHLTQSLGQLYRTLENRTECFRDMLRLQGRLDLVVERVRMSARSEADAAEADQAVVDYEESDDDDSEEEDMADGVDGAGDEDYYSSEVDSEDAMSENGEDDSDEDDETAPSDIENGAESDEE
ncbi:WD repeat-containing protein 43 [Gaertneriomyces sp. JEL0708]|nr:WD repeat-containing protein 43 [Gaertneriomyces sp. JEL0708]